MNGLSAVAAAQLVAAMTAVAVLAMTGGTLPKDQQFTLAVLAGYFHVVAVFYIYQGIARGRVSVIAPVSGVVGISLPVLADIVFIEMAKSVQCAGIVLAVIAIIFISQSRDDEDDRDRTSISIRCGLISGLGFGIADLCLGLMTTATAEGGLAVARMTGAGLSAGLMTLLWLGTARAATPTRLVAAMPVPALSVPRHLRWPFSRPALDANMQMGLLLCAMAGLLDCLGQLGYVLSATQGQMSVAAALVAMYPAVSIGLAMWLLNERVAPLQMIGIIASLSSIFLLAQ
ncbi:MAG: EamA family transporter [Hyphomicrobium sp.]